MNLNYEILRELDKMGLEQYMIFDPIVFNDNFNQKIIELFNYRNKRDIKDFMNLSKIIFEIHNIKFKIQDFNDIYTGIYFFFEKYAVEIYYIAEKENHNYSIFIPRNQINNFNLNQIKEEYLNIITYLYDLNNFLDISYAINKQMIRDEFINYIKKYHYVKFVHFIFRENIVKELYLYSKEDGKIYNDNDELVEDWISENKYDYLRTRDRGNWLNGWSLY